MDTNLPTIMIKKHALEHIRTNMHAYNTQSQKVCCYCACSSAICISCARCHSTCYGTLVTKQAKQKAESPSDEAQSHCVAKQSLSLSLYTIRHFTLRPLPPHPTSRFSYSSLFGSYALAPTRAPCAPASVPGSRGPLAPSSSYPPSTF